MNILKPCPFCGNKTPSIIESVEVWVLCSVCKASSDTACMIENAIAKWNCRTRGDEVSIDFYKRFHDYIKEYNLSQSSYNDIIEFMFEGKIND